MIEAHPAETNAWRGLFHLYAERYERYGIKERFSISLTEFMEYHPEDCEWMFKYCENRQEEERKIAEEAKTKSSALITNPNDVHVDLRQIKEQSAKGKVKG